MTRESKVSLPIVTSDDGTRCAAECPHRNAPMDALCMAFRVNGSPTNIKHGRAAACIAAEQAVASVPSCEGAWAVGDRVRHAAGWTGEVTYLHPNGNMVEAQPYNLASKSFYPLSALTRLPPDAPHLDGGARALDASEALREARVQGMREALEIVLAYTCGASSKCSRAIEAAIEAALKGER